MHCLLFAIKLCCFLQIIFVCCERLLELASRQCTNDEHKARLFITADRFLPSNSTTARDNLFRGPDDQAEKTAVRSRNGPLGGIPKNPLVAAISMQISISCESLLPLRSSRGSGMGGGLPPSPSLSTASSEPFSGSSTPRLLLPSVTQPDLSRNGTAHDSDGAIRLPTIATARHHRRRASIPSTASTVIEAFGSVKPDYSPECLVRVDGHKQQLNASPTAWCQLSAEDDPFVLAALMWDWFDELRVSMTAIFQKIHVDRFVRCSFQRFSWGFTMTLFNFSWL
jgi:hypothetical protein